MNLLRFTWLGRLLACIAATLVLTAAHAQPAADASRPILTITSKASAKPLQLDMAALNKLPQHSFKTNSPWTREPHTYSGPLMRDVLALAGAQGATTIKAVALNDYQISIPVEDAMKHPLIVANLIDGKAIPVRERGPLFVIYPFDSSAELKSQRYYERSIWQLNQWWLDQMTGAAAS